MRRLRPLLVLAVVSALSACTNDAPVPTDNDVMLRVVVDGQGRVTEVGAELVAPGTLPSYARPDADGRLRVQVLDGDEAMWTGFRRLELVEVDEDFQREAGIQGRLVTRDTIVTYLAYPDDGRSEATVRFELTDAEDEITVTELTVEIPRADAVGAAMEPLEGDVGARREALTRCRFTDGVSNCGEDEVCRRGIRGNNCMPDACIPTGDFDNSETVLQAGADRQIVVVPVGFASAADAEAYVQSVLDSLHARVDWFSENQGRIGFRLFRADCHYGDGDPDVESTHELLNWMRGGGGWDGLVEWTDDLPEGDDFLVVSRSASCGGRAERPGHFATVLGCPDVDEVADALAHEIGHMIAGLGDEYHIEDGDGGCGGFFDFRRNYIYDTPNVSNARDPSWFCPSDTGEIYAGQLCPREGVVGAVVTPTNRCTTGVARPCENSIMRHHWGAQFDPVGEAALSYALDTGDILGYEDCDRGCSADCTGIPLGTCALNGCNQVCNACADGERCTGTSTGDFMCASSCAVGDACVSDLGYEVCDGSASLMQDTGCDTGIRLAECNDGDLLPGACLMR